MRDAVPAHALTGALAGLVATRVMGFATSLLYEREGPSARAREEEARGGNTAYEIAARKIAALLGRDLSRNSLAKAGSLIHWTTGAGAGVAYAVLRGRVPRVAAGAGALYGTAFFLLVDEIGNVVLGLTPGPAAFPWQAHARGFAGHLVFGITAELALRALDRLG